MISMRYLYLRTLALGSWYAESALTIAQAERYTVPSESGRRCFYNRQDIGKAQPSKARAPQAY